MQKSKIGLIGLAVMGQNLARNIARNQKISVYNRTTKTMEDFIAEHGSENLVGEKALQGFVESLESPRKISIMVKAGKAVDAVIESLLPFLASGDTIIDFGNSLYTDTIRREKYLGEKNIHFFGCGVSGGEEGALNGPSLMPGGNVEVWKDLEPIFNSVAAKDFSGGSCVSYMGENGAGHFVKMVHNGIEYGVMAMMSEAYEIFSRGYKLSPPEIADIFETYNEGKLQSYLFEIAVPIFRKKDPLGETNLKNSEKNDSESLSGYLIDKILDKAGQKGTGMWTAKEGLEQGVGLSVITEAVYARSVSSFKSDRVELDQQFTTPAGEPLEDLETFVPKLASALYAGMLVSYAQGFDLLRAAANKYQWNLNYSEIARIWQGGCIIRAEILKTLESAFVEEPNQPLWPIAKIQKDLEKNWSGLRSVVSQAALAGIPVFCLGAALSSLEAMTNAKNSANFIQALRDFFGAHTFERIDRAGVFHEENWK